MNVGGSLLEFYYLFLVMAYLKKKKNNWIERNAGKGTLISICLIVGCTLLINAAGNMLHSESLLSRITFVFQRNNILVYSAAIFIFYLFQRVK